ncbi:MAG: acylphosphatase [Burkholderiaceae bacterium]|jgi:acylphosphatase|nr:acylphosphatase [Burkholderiaceae bacterium]
MAARRFVVRGIVQGVGFRHALCREAVRLGLAGWVRNRRDGTVEALAVGSNHALDALHRWSQRGPAAARVEAVEAVPLTPAEEEAFDPPAGTEFRQVATA